MTTKIFASLTAIVGSLAVVYSVLGAFGIELSQDQQDGIAGLLGLVLVVAGIWLHPDVSSFGVSVDGAADPPA